MTYVRLDVSIQAYLEQFQTDHVYFTKRSSLSDGQRNAGRREQGREGDGESDGWIVFEMMAKWWI